jgi:PAS domain S-box-containing protein
MDPLSEFNEVGEGTNTRMNLKFRPPRATHESNPDNFVEKPEVDRNPLLRALSNISSEGIGFFDLAGNILEWNPALEQLTGFDRDTVVGRLNAFGFICPYGKASRFYKKLGTWTLPFTRHALVHAKTGDTVMLCGNFAAVTSPSGKVIGCLICARPLVGSVPSSDTTDSMATPERLVIDSIPQLVWTAGPDGWIDFINERCVEYVGKNIVPFQRWSWDEFLHPDDKKIVLESWLLALSKGEAISNEYRLKRAIDGVYRWHLGRVVPLKDRGGRVLKWFGTCTDIEDQKRAQEQIRESENHLRNVLNTAPVMLWLSDDSAHLTFFNTRWLQFTGRTLEDELKETVTNIHPADIKDCWERYFNAFARRESYRSEFRMRRNDGEYRWILESGVPRLDCQGNFLGYIGSCIDITDRKVAEEKLRQSEERYRFVARATNDTIWDYDFASNSLEWSQGLHQKFGYPPDQVQPSIIWWKDALHAEDRDRVWEGFQASIARGDHSWSDQYRYRRYDGSYAFVEDRGYMIMNADGKVERMIGTMTDITEQKQAQDELEQSELRYRLVAKATNHAVWDWNLITNELNWNDAIRTTFLYPPEEVVDNYDWWLERLHPDDKDRIISGFHYAIATGMVKWSDEYRFRRGDGGYSFVIDRGYIVYDSSKKAVRMIGAIMDITERKLAEEDARRFKFISDNSSDAHFLMDRLGRFLYVNTVACERLGYSEEELLNLTVFDIDLNRENMDDFHRAFEKYKHERIRPSESVHRRKDGTEFPVEISSSAVEFDGEYYLFSVARDIAERKRAETALKFQAEELARSNAELQQFAYVASHDLKEPLRMVNSYLTLLERKYQPLFDEDGRTYIRFAVDGALRMHSLINDLLAYSRVGTRGRNFHPVDLNTVFSTAVSNLKAAIEESSGRVTRDYLPCILADATQMVQVLQNLIGNAIKFRSTAPPEVHVSVEKRMGEWLISVGDNGIGIEPRYANRIFIIFQRLHTREEYPGTGIGLAICKKIIERHGGRIWVESGPNAMGSVFKLTLPVVGAS